MGGSPQDDESMATGDETGANPSDDDATQTGEPSDPGGENTGLCGFSGEATAGPSEYAGTQDVYLVGDSGMGKDLCRVRFDLALVGEPAKPCSECEWSVLVEVSSAAVITDVDGVCAASDLALDQAAIDAWIGKRLAYGYIPEFTGHESVLMSYDDMLGDWEAITFASWDPGTKAFSYDKRDGFCIY